MADSDLSPHYLSPVAMKADETTGPRAIRPRFHRSRRVKPHHASGSWTVCIGKALDKSGKSLRRKDWYFAGMSEADANDRAASLQREWEFLVTNWVHLYGGRLRIINSPFADIPHWQPNL